MKHEVSVLRFMGEADVSFTNNSAEQKIRMAKVKIKVSGCFRTQLQARAWCWISSYLSSMAALGYNPLVAIQIALAGDAAAMIGLHYAGSGTQDGLAVTISCRMKRSGQGVLTFRSLAKSDRAGQAWARLARSWQPWRPPARGGAANDNRALALAA